MPEHTVRTTVLYGLGAGMLYAGAFTLLPGRISVPAALGPGAWIVLTGYTLLLARQYGRGLRSVLLPLGCGSIVIFLSYATQAGALHLLLVNMLLFAWIRSQLFPVGRPQALLREGLLASICLLAPAIIFKLATPVASGLSLGLSVWLFFQIQALFLLRIPHGEAVQGDRFEQACLTARRLLNHPAP